MARKILDSKHNLQDLATTICVENFRKENHLPIRGNNALKIPLISEKEESSVKDLLRRFYNVLVLNQSDTNKNVYELRTENVYKYATSEKMVTFPIFLFFFGIITDGLVHAYDSIAQLGGLMFEGNTMLLGCLFFLLCGLDLINCKQINKWNRKHRILLDQEGRPLSITKMRNNFEHVHLKKVRELAKGNDVELDYRLEWLEDIINELREYFLLVPKVHKG